jgi:hypothetical protein
MQATPARSSEPTSGKRPGRSLILRQNHSDRERMEALVVEFADGELTPGQLRAANERLRVRLAGLEARIADTGRVDVLAPLVLADDVRAAWEEVPRDQQRDRGRSWW